MEKAYEAVLGGLGPMCWVRNWVMKYGHGRIHRTRKHIPLRHINEPTTQLERTQPTGNLAKEEEQNVQL